MSKKKSIFQLLTEKPWEKDQIEADNEHEGHTVNLSKNLSLFWEVDQIINYLIR